MKKKKSIQIRGVFDFITHHPFHVHKTMRMAQKKAYEILKKVCEKRKRRYAFTMKAPTGSGKSDIAYTLVKTLKIKQQKDEIPQGLLIFSTPNLDLIQQMEKMFPGEVVGVRGRAEYPCVKYQEQGLNCGQIPYTICKTCRSRVRQDDGKVLEEGSLPCLFYEASYRAKHAMITVCTHAFLIVTQLNHAWEKPVALVIDEGHRLPEMAQLTLSTSISDWHLSQCIRLMESFEREDLKDDIAILKEFRAAMIDIIKKKPMVENGNDEDGDGSQAKEALLTEVEIEQLLAILNRMDGDAMNGRMQKLVAIGLLDGTRHIKELRQLEVIGKDFKRYATSFGYALPDAEAERGPLNYICAYSLPDDEAETKRVHRKLMICHWYVAGLLAYITDVPFFLNLSATFGNPKVYSYQSGIQTPFYEFPSTFPPENRRYYLPTNALDLTRAGGSNQNKSRSYFRAAEASRRFAESGIRSVVIVVSKKERTECLDMMRRHKINVLTARVDANAMQRFKEGEGDVLLGLSAHLAQGADFKGKIAQIVILLRPGFPVINSPSTQFEIRRRGDAVWGDWMHRVKIEFEQASGRIFRDETDIGAVICLASGYDRIVRGAVPNEFQSCIIDTMKFEECVEDALKLILCK